MTHVHVTEFDRFRVKRLIPVIRDIRFCTGLDLKGAKAVMDRMPGRITVEDMVRARQLAELLNAYDGCEAEAVAGEPSWETELAEGLELSRRCDILNPSPHYSTESMSLWLKWNRRRLIQMACAHPGMVNQVEELRTEVGHQLNVEGVLLGVIGVGLLEGVMLEKAMEALDQVGDWRCANGRCGHPEGFHSE